MKRRFLMIMALAAVAHAEPVKPAQRGKQLVDAQVATIGLKQGQSARALAATLGADVVIFGPDGRSVRGNDLEASLEWLWGNPHTYGIKVAPAKVRAGGNDAALWIVAEIAMTHINHEPEFPVSRDAVPIRLTELAVAEGGTWRIVAAHFGTSAYDGRSEPEPIVGATEAGPLSALLTSPPALDAALSADPATTVFGTEPAERAIGPAAAHKLLGRWKRLKLELVGKPRELRTKTWGYALANVKLTTKAKVLYMTASVFAVPRADGTWSAVTVQYAMP